MNFKSWLALGLSLALFQAPTYAIEAQDPSEAAVSEQVQSDWLEFSEQFGDEAVYYYDDGCGYYYCYSNGYCCNSCYCYYSGTYYGGGYDYGWGSWHGGHHRDHRDHHDHHGGGGRGRGRN